MVLRKQVNHNFVQNTINKTITTVVIRAVRKTDVDHVLTIMQLVINIVLDIVENNKEKKRYLDSYDIEMDDTNI